MSEIIIYYIEDILLELNMEKNFFFVLKIRALAPDDIYSYTENKKKETWLPIYNMLVLQSNLFCRT